MSDEAQLTPEAAKKEQEWRDNHGYKCPCWKCMYVAMPWVEMEDKSQRKIERLDSQVVELTKRLNECLGVLDRLNSMLKCSWVTGAPYTGKTIDVEEMRKYLKDGNDG